MKQASDRHKRGNQGGSIRVLVRLATVLVIFLISGYNLYLKEDSAPADHGISSGEIMEQESLTFRNPSLLDSHYEKHGIEMGFASAQEYEGAASAVVSNPESLHRYEREDGDSVYFLEKTGEFVIVSKDGYIRTYYYADKAYFERQ